MHRLLVQTDSLSQVSPTLGKEVLRHLKVLRPERDELVELFDGRGRTRCYRWNGSGLEATAAVVEDVRPTGSLTLFACVTKGSRWDWTIEKATELGATRIVPVISDRTIVRLPRAERAAKRERWQRIAEDAARQSDARWLPEILEAVDFRDVLPLVRETTCFVGALTTPPSPSLLSAVSSYLTLRPSSLSVFIGPEGDFTPEELRSLLDIAVPTSFGPTVLRAETAAIFALSVLGACRQS